MSDIWVGIDVSKARLEVAVRPTGETWSVSHDATGIRQLTKTLKKQTPQLIVLEATVSCPLVMCQWFGEFPTN